MNVESLEAQAGRRRRLATARALLAVAECENDVVAALLGHARALARADGIAVVRREDEEVRYLAEDAVGPLWSGQVFPIDSCLSGTVMLQNRPILIPDVAADRRVPYPLYAPTFVRSLAVFPIGLVRPRLAVGAYWAETGPIDGQAVDLLAALTRSAADALAAIHGTERPRARRFG